MKAIMVMYDTLSRRFLPNYGNDWVHAPNFHRLGERALTFDNSYVCSMPCMPARRDFHTGRHNFLHRSWGPMEPYDDSVPKMLHRAGIHTHLATDHNHYFEDGGLTYHTQYSTWEYFRGQEGDPWIGQLADPPAPDHCMGKNGMYRDKAVFDRFRYRYPEENDDNAEHLRLLTRQDWVNRQFMNQEKRQPQAKTFKAGLEFIKRNAKEDNWFLQIETFDPHEPFFTQQHYKDIYKEHFEKYKGRFGDWPMYDNVTESPEEVDHLRFEYASLITMCDTYLGKVLDAMDKENLWDDTMLIVWTDHGFLLGEHDWWGKCTMPFYQEVAHTPFYIWDPRTRNAGERRSALIQPSIDLPPTLLNYFGLDATKDMTGHNLSEAIAYDKPVRNASLFGMYGSHVNITDGQYVYMRAPAHYDNEPLHQYTLMPTHMRSFFDVKDFADMTLADPFSFTKGARTMKIKNETWTTRDKQFETMLWDIHADYGQTQMVENSAIEARLIDEMKNLMAECDAPAEQYQRLGLN